MEYLDYYDENDNYLGYETRDNIHKLGLWHKTVHCWLYTKNGQILFQIRKDNHKLYTTASGHVKHQESIEDAFKREVKEEIGLDLNYFNAQLINVATWQMDFKNDKGIITKKDRAKAHYLICEYKGLFNDFCFDKDEVLGLAIIDAQKALKLFSNEISYLDTTFIMDNEEKKGQITINDFLVLTGENAKDKYGPIINAIIKSQND